MLVSGASVAGLPPRPGIRVGRGVKSRDGVFVEPFRDLVDTNGNWATGNRASDTPGRLASDVADSLANEKLKGFFRNAVCADNVQQVSTDLEDDVDSGYARRPRQRCSRNCPSKLAKGDLAELLLGKKTRGVDGAEVALIFEGTG